MASHSAVEFPQSTLIDYSHLIISRQTLGAAEQKHSRRCEENHCWSSERLSANPDTFSNFFYL